MPPVPVEEVIAHIHGAGAEYVMDGHTKKGTGAGIAALTITRTSDGRVRVTTTFMFRVFEFEMSQQVWDEHFQPRERTESSPAPTS